MTTCKHCGAEIPDNAEFCPNCGQQNIDYTDESYLDSLLNSVVSGTSGSNRGTERSSGKKEKREETKKETSEFAVAGGADTELAVENTDEFDQDLDDYNIFDEFMDDKAIDRMISEELENEEPAQAEVPPAFEKFVSEEPVIEDPVVEESVIEEPAIEETVIEEPVSEEPVSEEPVAEEPVAEEPVTEEPLAVENAPEDIAVTEDTESENSIFDGFTFDEPEVEELQTEPEENTSEKEDLFSENTLFTEGLDDQDIVALDNLFQEIDEMESAKTEEEDNSLLHLLNEGEDSEAATANTKKGKKKGKKKDKKPLMVRLFGNVPLEPSKIKHEPTPEEIAEKKRAKSEQKQKEAEEKKKAADEKKAAALAAKSEKARLAQLAKEEKKARKMEQAKLILEEMKDSRINRAGAFIVFLAFALLTVLVIVGGNMVTYHLAITSAKKSFDMAINNSTQYYNDAYNQIYGLELKEEDVEFGDKVMTVMFVNKQLNSYNSYVAMGDEAAALDSLLKGLKRYEKYSMFAILAGYEDILDDLEYVQSQILAELDKHYGISLDEAMRLIKEQSAVEYSKTIYEIVGKNTYGQNSEGAGVTVE